MGFLRDRKLEGPDERPLYAYRVTESERRELREILRRADLKAGRPSRATAACFLLFAAGAMRLGHERGAWSWDPVLEMLDLGSVVNRSLTYGPLVEEGAKYWKRSVRKSSRGNRRFLFTAVLEGGFPLKLLQADGGHLRDWLVEVQRWANEHAADAGHVESYAADASVRLPDSLRCPELNALAAELCSEVRKLRAKLGDGPVGGDVAERLDRLEPGWRRHLPLELGDAAAETLVKTLLEVEGKAPVQMSSILSMERWLEPEGDGFRSVARVPDGATLDPRALPAEASQLLDDALRGRLVAAEGRELAILEKAGGGSETAWRLRPRGPWPLALDAATLVALRVGCDVGAPFLLPGGEPAEGDVLAFVRSDEGYRFASAGGLRTKADEAWLAFDPATVEAVPKLGSTLQALGPIAGTALALHRLSGEALLEGPDGSVVTAKTGVADAPPAGVLLLPRPVPPGVEPERQPASLGWPDLRHADGLKVRSDRVRWRRVGDRGEWHRFDPARPPLGEVAVAVLGADGGVVDRKRVAVLPEGLRVEAREVGPDGGVVELQGLRAARVVPTTADGLTIKVDLCGGDARLTIQSLSDRRDFSVSVFFEGGGSAELGFPVPCHRARFVDGRGRVLPRHQRLRLGRLQGARVRGQPGSSYPLRLTLAAPGGERIEADASARDGTPLALLEAEVLTLLRESDDLDAEVRLEVDGGELRVRRYGRQFERTAHGLRLGGPTLPGDPEAELSVCAQDLTDFAASPRTLWSGPDGEAASREVQSPDPTRPWLVWAEIDGRALSRPRALPACVNVLPHDSFARCATLPNTQGRREAMARQLEDMANDSAALGWTQLHAALDNLAGRLPLAALDWFPLLARCDRALAMFVATAAGEGRLDRALGIDRELPFEWELVPYAAWFDAFANLQRRFEAQLSEGQGSIVVMLLRDRLKGAAALRPELALTLMAVADELGLEHGINPPSLTDCEEAKQAALQRNRDWQWPQLRPLRPFAPDVPGSGDCAPHTLSVLAAPYAAARVVCGRPAGAELRAAIRRAKAFDPIYFSRAYDWALRRASNNC